MTLALYGKSRRRQGGLLSLGLLAVLIAMIAGVATYTSAFAHHNTITKSRECNDSWAGSANYVGGNDRRLLIIEDVVVNGQPYATSWSTDAGDSSPFGDDPISAYSLSSSDFWDNAPSGTSIFMWDDTDNGFSIYNRSGGAGTFDSNWGGKISLYERDGRWSSGTFRYKWTRVDVDTVTAPPAPTNCVPPPPETCEDLGLTLIDKFNWADASSSYVREPKTGEIPGVQVTITNGTTTSGNWSSTAPVDAIILKAAQDRKVDLYDPAATSGTFNNSGLFTPSQQPAGISNILFCGDGTVLPSGELIIKKVGPTITGGLASTVFGGTFSGPDSGNWSATVGNQDVKPGIANGQYTVVETSGTGPVTGGKIELVGYKTGTSTTACTTDPAGYSLAAGANQVTVTDNTQVVCVLNKFIADPTLTKVKGSGGVTPGGLAYWDVKVDNTANTADSVDVFLKDSATLASVVSGGSCTGTDMGAGVPCTVNAGAVLILSVTKDAPSAQCLPGSINNSVQMWLGDNRPPKGADAQAGGTPDTRYAIPGDPKLCGQPSITKKLVTGGTDPVTVTDPNAVAWTVVVTNPATLPGTAQTVVIRDSNVIVTSGPSFTNGADCTPNNATGAFQTALTGSGVSCTMPGSASVQSTITFTVKPSGTVARECQDKPFNNTASIQIGDADPINAVGPTITLQGDRTKCDAQLRVKKVVMNVVNDPTGFSGKITLNNVDVAGATFSGLTETAANGVLFLLPQGSVYRAVETPQSGYNLLGYAKGNWDTLACPAGPAANFPGETLDTSDIAPGGDLICIYNERATRNLTICKVVEGNGDLAVRSGQFKFDYYPQGGPTLNVAISASEPNPDQAPGAAGTKVCTTQSIPMPADKQLTVSEWTGVRPAGWDTNANDAAGYPKVQLGSGAISSNGTINIPAGTSDVTVTFYNREKLPTKNVTFQKYICNSLGDVAKNEGSGGVDQVGMPSMSAVGGLSGQLNQTDGPVGGGTAVSPSNDGRTAANCHLWGSDLTKYPEETGNWDMVIYDTGRSNLLQTVNIPAGGTTSVQLFDSVLLETLKASSNGARVEEVFKTGYGFASLKCYTDHKNQDNWEWLDFNPGGIPSGEVYCIAYNVKATKQITIEKRFVELNGTTPTAADVPGFTLNPSENTSCAAPVQQNPTTWTVTCTVPYNWSGTVTETPKAGWEKVTCEEPESSLSQVAGLVASITQFQNRGDSWTFCNRPFATIKVVKVFAGDLSAFGPFNFASDKLTLPSQSGQNGGQVEVLAETKVAPGTYNASELNGLTRAQGCEGDTAPGWETIIDGEVNGSPVGSGTGSASVSVTLGVGDSGLITITNATCGILASPRIYIDKYADPAGDRTGANLLGGFQVRVYNNNVEITGSPFTLTGATNPLFLSGLGVGTVRVEEVNPNTGGWKFTGSKTDLGNDGSFEKSVSTQPATENIDNGEVIRFRFYNQPRVNIEVNKTEVSLATPNGGPGNGWSFTLTGCDIVGSKTATTGTDGKVLFSDLSPAVGCSYTVTETVKSGWSAINPVQVTAPATAGQTAVLNFTNVKIEVCTVCITIVTPTPTPEKPTATPTATPTDPSDPTATPTDEPTKEPTLDETRGERTPGPGQTPIAPSTGTGFMGSGPGGVNMLFALVGLLAISLGTSILALGRKSSRR